MLLCREELLALHFNAGPRFKKETVCSALVGRYVGVYFTIGVNAASVKPLGEAMASACKEIVSHLVKHSNDTSYY